MKNIWKIILFIALIWMLNSCSNKEEKTNTDIISGTWELRIMESSNEGGGNDDTDLGNNSFR